MRGGRPGDEASIEIFRVDTPEQIAAPNVPPEAPPSAPARWRWIVPLVVVAAVATAVLWPSGGDAATAPTAAPTTTTLAAGATPTEGAGTLLLPTVPVGMVQGTAGRAAGRSTPGITEVWA